MSTRLSAMEQAKEEAEAALAASIKDLTAKLASSQEVFLDPPLRIYFS